MGLTYEDVTESLTVRDNRTGQEYDVPITDGTIRAAERLEDGTWQANTWVKQAILCGFRRTNLVEMEGPGFPMFDKTAYPPRHFGIEDAVRLVPGGR